MKTELHETLNGLLEVLRAAAADLGERGDALHDIIDATVASRQQAQLYGLDKEFNEVLHATVANTLLEPAAVGEKGLKQVISRMKALFAGRIEQFNRECQDDPAFAEVCSVVKMSMFPGLRIRFTDKSGDNVIVTIAGDESLMANMMKFQSMWAKHSEGPDRLLGHFRSALETCAKHLPKLTGDQKQATHTAMLYALFYACAQMPRAGEDDACPATPTALNAAEG
jgi:hypothetical protein